MIYCPEFEIDGSEQSVVDSAYAKRKCPTRRKIFGRTRAKNAAGVCTVLPAGSRSEPR